MSCIGHSSSGKSGRGFCVTTFLFLLLVLVALIFGLMHKSEQPQLLGRYSFGYALLLLGLFAAAAYLFWVIWWAGPRLESWTANLYVLLISTLIVLLAVEWGLRTFNPFGVEFFHILPYHMQGMVDDPLLGYKHPKSVTYTLGADVVKLNAQGLRDEEVPYAKPSDEKRILVLGDSVTFGWGVSQGETFSDRMESLLRGRTGDQWQVINAGVNGYNTEQEATYLRVEGMRYSPDYVLLIYVSNDVDPVIDPNVTTWRRHPSLPPSLPEAINRLRQLSFLFQLAKLSAYVEQRDLARAATTVENDAPATGAVRSMTRHPDWSRSKTALLDIAEQCKKAGIPFLLGLYSSMDDGSDPALMAELENAGIDAIHLRPAWRGVPADLGYVSRIDPHPSALLHEKIAEYLVDDLWQRGWLGESYGLTR